MAPDSDTAALPEGAAFDTHDALRIGLVWAALLMNFILALVNANAVPMTSNIVLAVQLAVTVAAGLVILKDPPTINASFVIAIVAVLVGYLLAGLLHQTLDPRGLYDVLIIPIFMLLGMTLHRFRAWMINVPMALITVVALIDGLLRDQFAAVVNPLSYYRSTRAWVATSNNAFSEDNGLFSGADRAGGQVFSFISDHRVGSIFLEPLSLSYFAVISVIAYAVIYREERRKFLASGALCLFLSLLADTRTAAFLVILFIVLALVVKRVERIVVFLVPLAIIVLGGLVYLRTGGVGGELTYRLGLTYKALLASNSLSSLLGDLSSEQFNDTGLVAIIHNVGVIPALVVIYLASGVMTFQWKRNSYVPLLAMVYVMVMLLFGGAVFSVKTAALFGLIVGASGRSGSVFLGRVDPKRKHLQTQSSISGSAHA